MSNKFTKWDGDYEKQFYDVQLSDGTVIKHCWPNAGKMCTMDNSGRKFTEEDNIMVMVSLTHPLDGEEK